MVTLRNSLTSKMISFSEKIVLGDTISLFLTLAGACGCISVAFMGDIALDKDDLLFFRRDWIGKELPHSTSHSNNTVTGVHVCMDYSMLLFTNHHFCPDCPKNSPMFSSFLFYPSISQWKQSDGCSNQ